MFSVSTIADCLFIQNTISNNTFVGYFDTYHPLAAQIAAGVLIGIVSIALIGVLCGLCGSPPERDPRLRTTVCDERDDVVSSHDDNDDNDCSDDDETLNQRIMESSAK